MSFAQRPARARCSSRAWQGTFPVAGGHGAITIPPDPDRLVHGDRRRWGPGTTRPSAPGSAWRGRTLSCCFRNRLGTIRARRSSPRSGSVRVDLGCRRAGPCGAMPPRSGLRHQARPGEHLLVRLAERLSYRDAEFPRRGLLPPAHHVRWQSWRCGIRRHHHGASRRRRCCRRSARCPARLATLAAILDLPGHGHRAAATSRTFPNPC